MSAEVKELVAESMMYERAISYIEPSLRALIRKKKRAEREAEVLGGKADGAYDIAVKVFKATLDELRRECDGLWARAERDADYHAKAADRLCEAVVVQAAQDYEKALCSDDKDILDGIEEFAQGDAERYTPLDLMDILQRIRKAQPLFAEKARSEFEEIIAETKELQKKGFIDYGTYSTHRCPLCGGGMSVYGEVRDRLVTIRCSNCALYETLNPEAERKKKNAERH